MLPLKANVQLSIQQAARTWPDPISPPALIPLSTEGRLEPQPVLTFWIDFQQIGALESLYKKEKKKKNPSVTNSLGPHLKTWLIKTHVLGPTKHLQLSLPAPRLQHLLTPTLLFRLLPDSNPSIGGTLSASQQDACLEESLQLNACKGMTERWALLPNFSPVLLGGKSAWFSAPPLQVVFPIPSLHLSQEC